MPICRVLRIKCRKRQDNSYDEPYIKVNGKRVWSGEKMSEGQTREIHQDSRFIRRAVVRLYEADWPDPDDFLGEHVITRADINSGEQELPFRESRADYSIWVIVLEDPDE